jgi:hypothetical protein
MTPIGVVRRQRVNECMQFHVTNPPVQYTKMLAPLKSFASQSIYSETVRCETRDYTDLKTTNPAALAMKTAVPL